MKNISITLHVIIIIKYRYVVYVCLYEQVSIYLKFYINDGYRSKTYANQRTFHGTRINVGSGVTFLHRQTTCKVYNTIVY